MHPIMKACSDSFILCRLEQFETVIFACVWWRGGLLMCRLMAVVRKTDLNGTKLQRDAQTLPKTQ